MTSIQSFMKKLFEKQSFITVVSGLPRSGTSMMMSALKAGGMPLLVDGMRQPDANNPKGYFEYERVKKLANGDAQWLGSATGKAVKIISGLLEYLPEDFNYRIIFMERDLEEILASQRRMLSRLNKTHDAQEDDEEIRHSFQSHLAAIKSWLADKPRIETCFISYNDVLESPVKIFNNIAEFLEHRVDPAAMVDVIDLALYREQKSK